MILKRIAGLSFGLAFLLAILLFTDKADEYLGSQTTVILFLIFGALGMVLNLISFRNSKQDPGFNLFYWIGSIVMFGGIIFRFMHWPFGQEMLIGGMVIVGASYFLPAGMLDKKNKDEDLLDN